MGTAIHWRKAAVLYFLSASALRNGLLHIGHAFSLTRLGTNNLVVVLWDLVVVGLSSDHDILRLEMGLSNQ